MSFKITQCHERSVPELSHDMSAGHIAYAPCELLGPATAWMSIVRMRKSLGFSGARSDGASGLYAGYAGAAQKD